ncbi:NADPH:quinone reductase-like Zn-dependent oxidoreductase [Haloactinospora alba]|uniref:NADPH:quinone reductase-like Zn-dependent oxidoreductase n=1 Tax=Haloactinospora alba TaxID=405555 RepID=A0A543NIL5_9ACTN|nr:zinc-binding dehydrogenase [Haloactinospora alba]TQN31682.1 NADPH:quinone reductase-like Zn-dependent oxidoreductase [Haloactinospora alba]
MRTSMMAAVLTGFGGPERLRVQDDTAVPCPGRGEVLIRVAAAAVNNTDLWTRQGAYGLPEAPSALAGWRGPIDFPRIQGGDIAGTVVETGEAVDPALCGTRVLVDPALYDAETTDATPVGLLGSEANGGFAQYVVVASARVHAMTGSPLSDEQLACLPIAYGTAMGMLERARITAGESVLVTGASGGVGLALVQLAAARGAHVIAITTRDKGELVSRAGARTVIHRDADDALGTIAQAVPKGLDAVADVAGGDSVNQIVPLLRDGGRWVIAGAVAGSVISFDLRRLYLHNLTLIGSSMHTPDHFAQLAEAARHGHITPRVAARYPLSEIHAAQHEFSRHTHVGKITITP